MSKKIKIEIQCDHCKKTSIGELYRSIWVEEPENLDLVLNDKINVVTCPNCSRSYKVPFPFLCTNVKKGFAIWYEPTKDPQIDEDIEQYRKHVGPSSFYAKAERIKDWDVFKEKLAKLSSQSADHKPSFVMSGELKQKLDGFVNHIATSINKKTARQFSYSFASFCCASFFIVFFRCNNYGFKIESLIPIAVIIVVFAEVATFILKRNDFRMMKNIKSSFSIQTLNY